MRSLRCEGDSLARPSQADGAYRTSGSGGSYLVLQGNAEPLGQFARDEDDFA